MLLCDYDRPDRPPSLPLVRAIANKQGLRVRACRYDKTRHGWHLVIYLRDPIPNLVDRVAFQMRFGSDLEREGLNLRRAQSLTAFPSKFWEARFNLLFERKLAA